MSLAFVDDVQRPTAVGVALRLDDLHHLRQSIVGCDTGAAQVLETAKHVVEVPGREREPMEPWIGDLTGRQAPGHAAVEEERLAAATGRRHRRRAIARLLELQ